MDGQSYEVISELSVALAGFSGVAAALQSRAGHGFSERELLALRQMLGWSGLAFAFSLLPAALIDFDLSPETTQALCSGSLGLSMLAFLSFVLWRNLTIRRAGDPGRVSYLYVAVPVALAAEIAALILSGLGVIGPSAGVFRLGLVMCLGVAFIVFSAWLIYRIE